MSPEHIKRVLERKQEESGKRRMRFSDPRRKRITMALGSSPGPRRVDAIHYFRKTLGFPTLTLFHDNATEEQLREIERILGL